MTPIHAVHGVRPGEEDEQNGDRQHHEHVERRETPRLAPARLACATAHTASTNVMTAASPLNLERSLGTTRSLALCAVGFKFWLPLLGMRNRQREL